MEPLDASLVSLIRDEFAPTVRVWFAHNCSTLSANPSRTGVAMTDEAAVGEKIAKTIKVPVSVLMERREVRVGRWDDVQWNAVGVLAGAGERSGCTLVHEASDVHQYLWTGLACELYKDGCESYWYNLQSETPFLFVVCFLQEDEEENAQELMPVLVTASQDEANAHLESDDPVYSLPMPEAVLEAVERFVVTYYEPEIKKKRRRRDWTAEHEDAQKNRRH